MEKRILQKRNRIAIDLILCALIGGAVFLLLFGTMPLSVTFDRWILSGYVEEDIVQHYAGWMAFRDGAWTFPIGKTGMLGYPDGMYISFTDSLPWISVLLKLFSNYLPETFQFFGWVNFLCFILQGFCAGLLLDLFLRPDEKTGWERFLARAGLWAGAFLFSIAPILLDRAFRHTGLAFQWIVLLSLYAYFAGKKKPEVPGLFLFLNVFTVGIHPYFFPATFGLLTISVWEHLLGKYSARAKKKAAGFYVLTIAAVLISGFLLGLFGSGVSGGSGGYGYYSMNLNALWNPTGISAGKWSLFLPVLPQMAGNYDGFNYLGFGFLLLLPVCAGLLLYEVVKGKVSLKDHVWLILYLIACTLFAVSHQISFGERMICTIPLMRPILKIFAIFRSSGRIFYPVYYMLMVMVIRELTRIGCFALKRTARFGIICLVPLGLLVLLQSADLLPALAEKHGSIEECAAMGDEGYYDPAIYENHELQSAFEAYDRVELLTYHHDYTLSAAIVKKHDSSNILPTNRGAFDEAQARCDRMIMEIAEGLPMEEGALYITNDELLKDQLSWGLSDALAMYDLGDYAGIGRVTKETEDLPRFVSTGEAYVYHVNEKYSGDIDYLLAAEDDQIIVPSTIVFEKELADAKALVLDGKTYRILDYSVYSNENIRDHIYITLDGHVNQYHHQEEFSLIKE